MKTYLSKKLQQSAISWKELALIGGLAILAVVTLSFSSLGELLKTEWVDNSLYQLRDRLGQSPKMASQLQLILLDESDPKNEFNQPSLNQWQKALQHLSSKRPKAVIIQGLFSKENHRSEIKTFIESVQRLNFPVLGTVSYQLGEALSPLSPNRKELKKESYLASDATEPSFLMGEEAILTGISPNMEKAFRHVGHSTINPGEPHLFRPLVGTGKSSVVPHVSFLLGELKVNGDSLYWNQVPLPTDSQGRVRLNFLNPKAYAGQTTSVRDLMTSAESFTPIPNLRENAIILISTKAQSQIQTPFGETSAHYATASILNSALTGQWIAVTQNSTLWIVMAGLCGLLFACFTGKTLFWAGSLGVPVLVSLLGAASFVFSSSDFPWFFSLLSFSLTSSGIYLRRSQLIANRVHRLRSSLDGLVPPALLEEMSQQPIDQSTASKEQVATVMFIDIVGYFLTVERQHPDRIFRSLRNLHTALTQVVHNHGGIVSKTIGDGMLCFFGCRYGNGPVDLDHADEALACAIDVQRRILQYNLDAAEKGEQVYPLRIGINTGNVYVGNLGTQERLDFTLIGHTINFAKRLETACDDYCIMMGAETRDILVKSSFDGIRFTKRKLQVKHYDELIEAHECDPFCEDMDDKAKVITAFRKSLGKDRRHARWAVPDGLPINVRTEQGAEGFAVNFSKSGLGLVLDVYLAKSVTLEFSLNTPDGILGERLEAQNMGQLKAIVRWGRPLDDGKYLHGIEIRGLSEEQSILFLQEMRHILTLQMPKAVNG